MLAVFSKAIDYGVFEFAVDGKTIGKRIDLYAPMVTTTEESSLGNLHLDAGKHVLKATAVGRNANSTGHHRTGDYILGLDYLRLKR